MSAMTFHITEEGAALKQGFNFYPLNDSHSTGVRVLIGRTLLYVRFSRRLRRWITYVDRLIECDATSWS